MTLYHVVWYDIYGNTDTRRLSAIGGNAKDAAHATFEHIGIVSPPDQQVVMPVIFQPQIYFN